MTSTSRSLEDFISRLKTLKEDIKAELVKNQKRLDELTQAKTTLEQMQIDSPVILDYNSKAIKDLESRINSIPNYIERLNIKLTKVDGSLEYAKEYDQQTCQHTLEVSGHDYHNNVAEYTCTKCGVHR